MQATWEEGLRWGWLGANTDVEVTVMPGLVTGVPTKLPLERAADGTFVVSEGT